MSGDACVDACVDAARWIARVGTEDVPTDVLVAAWLEGEPDVEPGALLRALSVEAGSRLLQRSSGVSSAQVGRRSIERILTVALSYSAFDLGRG